MNEIQPKQSLVNIQYLRALAALMVVWFHARGQFEWVKEYFSSNVGENGVDLFFVISGFIMVYTTHGKNITPWEFFKKRLERVIPLYWLATLGVVLVATVKPSLLKSTILSGPHILSSLAFIPMPSPAFPEYYWPLVIPGWTLNYEMAFYAVFAITLCMQGLSRLLALTLVLVASVAVGNIFGLSGIYDFYSNSIILTFLLGSAIGYMQVRGVLKQDKFVGIFLVILGVCFFAWMSRFDTNIRFISAGLPSAMIVIGACMIPALVKSPMQFVVKLGDASYSIYLSQVFVLALSRNIIKSLDVSIQSPLQAWIYMFSCLLMCAVCGYIVFYLVENPISRIFSRR